MPAPHGNQYALGNDGGRPTKLTDALIERARTYLDWCNENPIVREKTKTIHGSDKSEVVVEKEVMPRLPNLADYAMYLGIGRSTVNLWEEEDHEFMKITSEVRTASEAIAVRHSFAGTGSSNFGRFYLSAQHGYREKTESSQEVKVTGNLTKLDDDQLAKLIASLQGALGQRPDGEAEADQGEPA